jgi:hypothetical protein
MEQTLRLHRHKPGTVIDGYRLRPSAAATEVAAGEAALGVAFLAELRPELDDLHAHPPDWSQLVMRA